MIKTCKRFIVNLIKKPYTLKDVAVFCGNCATPVVLADKLRASGYKWKHKAWHDYTKNINEALANKYLTCDNFCEIYKAFINAVYPICDIVELEMYSTKLKPKEKYHKIILYREKTGCYTVLSNMSVFRTECVGTAIQYYETFGYNDFKIKIIKGMID